MHVFFRDASFGQFIDRGNINFAFCVVSQLEYPDRMAASAVVTDSVTIQPAIFVSPSSSLAFLV